MEELWQMVEEETIVVEVLEADGAGSGMDR